MFEMFHSDGETPFDTSKFPTTGYDLGMKDPDTIMLAEYIGDLLVEGYKKTYIGQCLAKELGLKYLNADALVAKAFKMLQKKNEVDSDTLRSSNLKRLTHIYETAIQQGDLKNAIAAVKEINALFSLDIQKLEVTTNDYKMSFDYDEEEK